jgi:peptidoglycan/LPS O-acetylase OafA/YrhL
MKDDIRSLTGIRGVFSVYVMLYHFVGDRFFKATGGFLGIIGNGYLAVDLFFILSGFIMSYVYADKMSRGLDFGMTRDFYAARFARIYPLYIFILLLVMVFSGFDFSLFDVLSNVSFSQVFFNNSIIGVSWSLSAEMVVYLLFPVLLFVLSKTKKSVVVSAVVAIFSLACISYSGVGIKGGMDVVSGWLALVRCLAEYILGISGFLIFRSIGSARKWTSLCTDLLSVAAIFLLCFRGCDFPVVLVMFIIITMLPLGKASFSSRILSLGPVYYVGQISYSIYLWHSVNSTYFLSAFQRLNFHIKDNPYFFKMALIVETVALAVLTYHFVEVPCRRYLKRRRAP